MYDNAVKKRLFDNISYKLIQLNMKTGDFEKSVNVSPGYMSRIRNDEKANPSTEFLINTSIVLGTSVDVLVNVDLSTLTETEKYTINFLNKLIRDTKNEKLYWETRFPIYFESFEPHPSGDVDHPLLSGVDFPMLTETEYPRIETKPVFISKAYGINTVINKECYELRLKNGTMLYVMNIKKSGQNDDNNVADITEVWMSAGYNEKQFLCSSKADGKISDTVNALYSSIADYTKHPQVGKEYRNAIDAFMNDDLIDDKSIFDEILEGGGGF